MYDLRKLPQTEETKQKIEILTKKAQFIQERIQKIQQEMYQPPKIVKPAKDDLLKPSPIAPKPPKPKYQNKKNSYQEKIAMKKRGIGKSQKSYS